MNPYWLFRAFAKTPNISHAATTGLESAGEKQLSPTVLELIENLRSILLFFFTINREYGMTAKFIAEGRQHLI